MNNSELRLGIIKTALRLSETGLSVGMSGNVSTRAEGGFLITPSGMEYSSISPEDIVFVDFDGNADGRCKPSSEWRFHRDIYQAYLSAGAIVHAHPPYSTALACIGSGIPAFHYMVAAAGGKDIRCAGYQLFGSEDLSIEVIKALDGRRACLLANHGLIAYGGDLENAFSLALEVEELSRQYQLALQIGKPNILSDSQMDEVLEKFKTYGEKAQK